MNRRLFIVGCPRSGTTILQAMLSAHPCLVSFPETHFFIELLGRGHRSLPSFYRDGRSVGLRDAIRSCVGPLGVALTHSARSTLFRNLGEAGAGDDLQRLYPTGARRVATHVRAFLRVLDTLAEAEGASGWVEKSPENLFFVPPIRKFAVDAGIIHVQRRGRDVAASLWDARRRYPEARSWRRLDDPGRCADLWIDFARETRRLSDRPGHFLVDYHELVGRPQEVLREVCGWAGLEFEERLVSGYADGAARIATQREGWKRGVYGNLRDTSKFEAVFSPEERERVDARLRAAGFLPDPGSVSGAVNR